jgi:hypothetical protein
MNFGQVPLSLISDIHAFQIGQARGHLLYFRVKPAFLPDQNPHSSQSLTNSQITGIYARAKARLGYLEKSD